MLSAANLLEVAMPPNSRYSREITSLLPETDRDIWYGKMATLLGILKSAAAEWRSGLIGTLALRFTGLVFEDFLKYARLHNDAGRKVEAAVLASAVLEDAIQRLCEKHAVASEDNGLRSLINALKSRGVFGRVEAEQLQSFAVLRNHAFHAKWDKFDERDLRQVIDGLEELLEIHFA